MDSDAVFEKVDRILGGRLKASNKLGAQAEPNGTVAPGPKKPNSAKTPGAAGASTSASGSAKDSAPLPAEDVEDAAAVEGEQEKKVWIPELKRLIQVKDARSPTPQVIPEESFKRRRKRVAKDPDGPYKDYAMLSRKILGPGGREYRIEIQSQGLRKIFQDIGRPYRELDLDASPILIRYPFQCLFFLRDRIRELSTDETVATDTRQELEELLNFIASEPVLQNVIKLYDDSVPRGKIPRSILWTLYRPHDWIYMRETVNPWTDHESEYFAVVSRVEAKVEANTGIKTHKVYFVVGFHDGRKFDLRERWFWVDPLPNEVLDISTDALRLIPLRFIPTEERDAIRSRLLARGKKYISLSTRPVTFMQYKGPITIADDANSKLLGPIGSGHEGIHSNWETNQRVIIDLQAQRELCKSLEVSGESMSSPSIHEYLNRRTVEEEEEQEDEVDDSISIDSDDANFTNLSSRLGRLTNSQKKKFVKQRVEAAKWTSQPLSDEDYLLCPSWVFAFLLEEKMWVGYVLLDCLESIAWKADPYEFLQLPSEKKIFIKSLVQGFGARRVAAESSGGQQAKDDEDGEEFDDIIEGKGRGLIFLLHGPPGLGKTLTAESVAESTHRPLYQVSTGDLSTDVVKLEKQLSEIFRLGLRWGAVVLLDEADVLMTRRSSTELQRNAIVAVFLRMLEYYNGMLFLTTNRLEDFDDAFYNRVHVTVKYDALSKLERTNIWRQHLTRACKRNRQTEPTWDNEIYETLSSIDTNGRDIRNYTRTAYGLATALKEDLAVSHVISVIHNNLSRERAEALGEIFAKLEHLGKQAGKRAVVGGAETAALAPEIAVAATS